MASLQKTKEGFRLLDTNNRPVGPIIIDKEQAKSRLKELIKREADRARRERK